MKGFFKIILLVAAILPIWLTIAAMGATSQIPSTSWKDRINQKLLNHATRKIQITEMLMTSELMDEAWINENFEIDLTGIRPIGSNMISLKFLDAEGKLRRLVRLPVKLYVQDKLWVLARELPRGMKVAFEDLKQEWRETANWVRPISNSKDIVGRVARMNLSEGDVVVESSLEKENLISKGDRIKIAVVGNGVALTAVGIAQENGLKGQTIKVLNVDSRKEIVGTVTKENEVEVRI